MTSRRFSPLLAGLSALAATAAVGVATPASAVTTTTLYANPQGTGSACNKVDPCDLATAFTNAASGDNVLIEPGTYQQGTTSLSLTATGVHVSAVPNAAAPVIVSGAPVGVEITQGSSLSDLVVSYSGTHYGVLIEATGSASHVAVTASASGACSVLGTLTDSLCVTTAANSQALGGSQGLQTVSPVLRGVTAVATQKTSAGMLFSAPSDDTMSVSATNVIAQGGTAGIEANAGNNSTLTITVSHSDFAGTLATSSGGTAEVVTGAGNISGRPKFVNAAKGNYQEATGSPTINAGAADSKTDLTDLAGRPRVIGGHVDMGAYEYAPIPTLHTPTVKAAAKSVKLSVTTNPNGRATTVYFVVTGGKKPIKSAKFAAGAGATLVTVSTRIKGLTPKTKYKVYSSATNSAGKQTTKTIKFTTT